MFGIFCLIGIRKPKPTLRTSPLVLKENNKLNIVCSPTPALDKTGVVFAFCHELESLRVTVYYSSHIYCDENKLPDENNNKRWYHRHRGWLLQTIMNKRNLLCCDTDVADNEEVLYVGCIFKHNENDFYKIMSFKNDRKQVCCHNFEDDDPSQKSIMIDVDKIDLQNVIVN